MPDYKKMYFALAARVADAMDILQAAAQEGEDTYADCGGEEETEDGANPLFPVI